MTLEARAACADLIAAFAYHVDHRQFDAAVDLFAEDGCFERPDLIARGRTEIAALWRDRPASLVTRHVCAAPLFLAVEDHEVRTATYFTLYMLQHDGPGPPPYQPPTAVGEYHDAFALVAGRWRIRHRRGAAVLAGR